VGRFKRSANVRPKSRLALCGKWLARRSAPSGVRAERLAELSSLVERLARVIRPTYIPVWLSKPIPALDDDKPIDRIAKGDYRAVARLISDLEDVGAS
jgi:hypothetical protein